MSVKTTNLKLVKPELTDVADITSMNQNWDILDEELQKCSKLENGKIPSNQMPSHKHTKSEITDFPTSMTPTAHTHTKSEITDFEHNQSASTITAGTLGGKVQANASASATVGNAQVRNIYAGTDDMTAGTTTLTSGTIYVVYE